jgi:transcriptional regulator with GAF, ATPase, and Fis domain
MGQPVSSADTNVKEDPATAEQAELARLRTEAAQLRESQAMLEADLASARSGLMRAVEQQTATAEILRLISTSPRSLKPVFDSILDHATRLCGAELATLGLFDGARFAYVAHRGGTPEFVARLYREPIIPAEGTNLWNTLHSKRAVHVPDLLEVPRVSSSPSIFRQHGVRSMLSVPMLNDERAIGTLVIYRTEVRPFEQDQINVVSTFARQAVIAIENARLFNETKEALEQQTVVGDILRVISRSPTDVQPVFEAIVKSGVSLFAGMNMSLRLVKGDHTDGREHVIDQGYRRGIPRCGRPPGIAVRPRHAIPRRRADSGHP